MSVFPEEVKKADDISRKEENLQRYRTQLIEQSIQLQTSNINDRIMKRKTRTMTQSFIKNSFVRDFNKENNDEDSFSTTSSILTSHVFKMDKEEEGQEAKVEDIEEIKETD